MVRLREGLLTAKGQRLDAQDVLFALQRARRGAAVTWWGDLPPPVVHPADPLAVLFATSDAPRVGRILSSPLSALVPRGFNPASPDGTGGMTAELAAGRLVLRRNRNAARGESFLDEIAVEQAAGSLGLAPFVRGEPHRHRLARFRAPRPQARSPAVQSGERGLDHPAHGERGGPLGGAGERAATRRWDSGGTIVAVRAEPTLGGAGGASGAGGVAGAGGQAEWGAKPCDLLVQEGSAYLEELARTLSSLPRPLGPRDHGEDLALGELARRRAAQRSAYCSELSARSPPRGRRRSLRSPLPPTRLAASTS